MDRKAGIGDPVEVRAAHREEGIVWLPATVVEPPGRWGEIGVAFADGTRRMVQAGNWRRVRHPATEGRS